MNLMKTLKLEEGAIMSKYFIFVEGKNDLTFIRDYIKHISNLTFPELSKTKQKKFKEGECKQLRMQVNGLEIELRAIDGINLEKQKTQIEINHLNDVKNLIILDTDTSDGKVHPEGGVRKRKKRIKAYENDWDVSLPNFLIPNDKDEGNIENLFDAIKSPIKWEDFNNCYNRFCRCIDQFSSHTDYFNDAKNIFYTYIMLYEGSEKAKEGERVFIGSDLWDLDNNYLNPLKDFLLKHIPLLKLK